MAINIKFDSEHNVIQPKITLARRSGRRIANVPAYNINITKSFNSYAELSFDVSKYDNGDEYKYWDAIKDLRLVFVKDWNMYFEIQVQVDESNETIKHVSGRTLGESELSQVNLYDIEINTESDIAREDYSPTVLYNEDNADASLLNRILSKAPHYSIGHVDNSIKNIQRTFTFNDKSIYDAFSEISEEINCLFVINSGMVNNVPARIVNVYDLEPHCTSCWERGPFDVTDDNGNVIGEISSPISPKHLRCKKCGESTISLGYGKSTPIFVSVENLASNIQYDTDVDSVKNCFKLEAGDDLMTATIRNINPNGSSYIWHISDEMKEDMSDALVDRINSYDESYDYYMNSFTPSVDEELLARYNSLVEKYQAYNPDIKQFDTEKKGFSNLVQAFYDNMDFESYLESVFMPAPEMPDIGADVQAAKLTSSSIGVAAVSNLRTCSTYTATASVLSVAKTLIDAGYSVKAATSQYADNTWTGTLTVTNNSDSEDTASTGSITVNIVDDYQVYVRQSIDKQLNSRSDEYADMITVFSYDNDRFAQELQRYCVSELEIFHDSCQAVLDILIKQGASSIGTFYDNYYAKLGLIDAELMNRNSEVATIREMQAVIREMFDSVRSALNFETYLGTDLWHEFVAYRREDTYSNGNFISDGLDNADIVKRALEFMEIARKDIYRSSTLQHSITANIADLLTMEEFLPIVDYFEDGNWIHIKVDDKVYRLRLIEYSVSFENNDIEVKFSDVIESNGSVSDLESIVGQMKSISSSYDFVARQAALGNKGNETVKDWIQNGLDTTSAKIINSADNQSQEWGPHGMLFKQKDPMLDMDTGEQLKIVNSTIAITDNNWETVKTAIGKFYYIDPETGEYVQAYGINGEVLVGKLILGQELGIYSESQSMKFNNDGLEITNGTNTFKVNPNDLSNMFVLLNDEDKVLYTDASGNTVYKGSVIVEGDNVSVSIDPNSDSVFRIYTVNGDVISVDGLGNAHFSGSISSNDAKIGNDTKYISYKNGNLEVRADSVSIGGNDVSMSIANAQEEGSKYATNYLYYSPARGLVVSDSAPSSDDDVDDLDSFNSRVTADGFDIYEDGLNRIAHFGQRTILGRNGSAQQIVDGTSLVFTTKDGEDIFAIRNDVTGVGYVSEDVIKLSDYYSYLKDDGTIDKTELADILASYSRNKSITSSPYDYVSAAYNTRLELKLFGYAYIEVTHEEEDPEEDDSTENESQESTSSTYTEIVKTNEYKWIINLGHDVTYNNGVMTASTITDYDWTNFYGPVDMFAESFPDGSKNHELFIQYTLRYNMTDVQMTLGSRSDESTIGTRSVSIGSDNTASGTGSVAIGKDITVVDDYSVIVGEKNSPIVYADTGNNIPTAFAVGTNGSTPFAVLKDGNIIMSKVNSGEVAQRTYNATTRTDVRVDFQSEYPTPPFIFLTLNENNIPNNKTDITGYGNIQIYKKVVDTKGFTATVVNGSTKAHTFSFSWFAISTM